MSVERPLKLYQRLMFLGLDGRFHTAKVVTVTDQDNCFACIIPNETPRHLQRDTSAPWRGSSFFVELVA